MQRIPGQAPSCPPSRTIRGSYRSRRRAASKQGAVSPHAVQAIHIAALSPGHSFYNRRTSKLPGSQIENGRRRLVFSFAVAQAALLFYSVDNLPQKVFRTLFRK